MKSILQNRPNWILVLSLIFAAAWLFCCDRAFAQASRADTTESPGARSVSPADRSPLELDRDPEYVRRRSEYNNRFNGLSRGVSPEAYARAVAAARALPSSPLLGDRAFVPAQNERVPALWTSPIAPPMEMNGNDYGGNATGRIGVLAIDPTNANIVYTGSTGGLAKSSDAGVTWQYLSDSWASQQVSSIAVDPNAPAHVYVGTGSEERLEYSAYGVGLYRSFDGGASWSGPLGASLFAGTTIRAISIDSNATIYVANGVPSGDSPWCTDLSARTGLWRSTDSGVSWTRLRAAPAPAPCRGIYDVAVDRSTQPSTLYLTEDDGVFKSVDPRHLGWAFIHGPLAGGHNRVQVVNSTLYLMGSDAADNLYKYQGGQWTQIPTACPPGADGCQSAYIGMGAIAVSPANSQIIVGGGYGLFRTANEGMTWTQIGHANYDDDPTLNVHADHRSIAFSPSSPSVVYEGNDGGIVRSVDSGQHWTNLNQNFPGGLFYNVSLSRDGSMVGGTQDSGALFSYLGAPWHQFIGGDADHILVDPFDSTFAYGNNGPYAIVNLRRFNMLTRETTLIAPAALVGEPCAFVPPLSMNLSHPERLIAACKQLARTSDARASPVDWKLIGPSFAGIINAACEAPSNFDVIYAVENWDTVWVTSNANAGDPEGAGAAWQEVSHLGGINQGINQVVVDPTNPDTAYLACDDGVRKTTNRGVTWTRYGESVFKYWDVVIDPAYPTRVFAAANSGVYLSTNGGAESNWADISLGIPSGMQVRSLSFNAISRQLAAATFGRGVYLRNYDDVPPTVWISSPNYGATVSGLVTISAVAADNHRVAGVQFKVGTTNIGPEVTSLPYSVTWDTAGYGGNRTLTAVARDPAGNPTTSAGLPVFVTEQK